MMGPALDDDDVVTGVDDEVDDDQDAAVVDTARRAEVDVWDVLVVVVTGLVVDVVVAGLQVICAAAASE